MSKRMIGCAIAAALLGGGLVWAADHRAEDGIAGWETLNAGMAQALGVSAGSAATAGESGKEGGGAEGTAAVVGSGAGEGAAAESGGVSGVVAGVAGNEGGVNGGMAGAGGSGALSDSEGTGVAVIGSGGSGGASSGTAGVAGSAGAAGTAAPAVAADGRVNVNLADTAALMDLPGIGEKKAQAIIDYRSTKGAFRSLTDLGKVKGIGPKLLEQLKPLVVF